jgi:glycerate kinase
VILATTPRSAMIAPDKFKGSLASSEVAEAIARGFSRALPEVRCYQHPVADGGEGTVAMALRSGFRPVERRVCGPMWGQEVTATFAVREDTAVIEMASSAGLSLVPSAGPTPESARNATTYGVGQLLSAALDEGVTSIILGVGGSATTDGGAGALQALGAVLIDRAGNSMAAEGAALASVSDLDLSTLDRRAIYQADIVVACDVEAVLTGSHGAAAIFSQQKGADARTVALLDEALTAWTDVVTQATGVDHRGRPGTGAAGGLAFGLAGVLGARIASGVDVLLDISGFDQAVAGCDLVVVGEGSLDHQSLLGKGPIGVARRAADLGVPSIAVVGRRLISEVEARRAGLHRVLALTDVVGERRSLEDTAAVIEEVVGQALSEMASEHV